MAGELRMSDWSGRSAASSLETPSIVSIFVTVEIAEPLYIARGDSAKVFSCHIPGSRVQVFRLVYEAPSPGGFMDSKSDVLLQFPGSYLQYRRSTVDQPISPPILHIPGTFVHDLGQQYSEPHRRSSVVICRPLPSRFRQYGKYPSLVYRNLS